MNNVSPLPISASDARLSRPEAAAPDASSAELKARQLRLRRVVAWVVGGATLLMCAGLVRAAIRSSSEPVALATAALVPAARTPSTEALAAAQSPVPQAVTAAVPTVDPAKPLAAKPAKKLGAVTHLSKAKHPAAKAVVARH
jgi:hypothetical protein